MDWLDLLAVQGTLKSLLQYHSSKAPILAAPISKEWLADIYPIAQNDFCKVQFEQKALFNWKLLISTIMLYRLILEQIHIKWILPEI